MLIQIYGARSALRERLHVKCWWPAHVVVVVCGQARIALDPNQVQYQ
jgi:hypothetical protein